MDECDRGRERLGREHECHVEQGGRLVLIQLVLLYVAQRLRLLTQQMALRSRQIMLNRSMLSNVLIV